MTIKKMTNPQSPQDEISLEQAIALGEILGKFKILHFSVVSRDDYLDAMATANLVIKRALENAIEQNSRRANGNPSSA